VLRTEADRDKRLFAEAVPAQCWRNAGARLAGHVSGGVRPGGSMRMAVLKWTESCCS